MLSRFFFELYPSSRTSEPANNEEESGFNPYKFIGSITNYYNFDWKTATQELSFQQLLLLSASVPKHETKEEKEKKKAEEPKDFTDFIINKMSD